jgi:hypothetical protein
VTEEIEEDASGIGSTEHDKDMIDKADNSSIEQEMVNKEVPTPSRPEWLPEKYKTVDDFLAGHKALEEKLGNPDDREDPSNSKGEETVPNESDSQTTANDVLGEFHQEYAENGELAPESYKKLEELGYSKDVVDTHIEGIKAIAATTLAKAHGVVGGEEEYNSMVDWAVDNMSEAEIESYNKQLAGDDAQWELALRGLHDKYLNSGEAPVSRIRSGEKPVNEGIKPFADQVEVKLAMSDKRYKNDPSYRKQVEDRLAISDDNAMGVGTISRGVVRHG